MDKDLGHHIDQRADKATVWHVNACSRHRQIGQSNCDIAANCGKKIAVSLISIYHKGEECFWRALIGWRLASTTHLRAAWETNSRVNVSVSECIVVDWLILLVSVWYILKQLLSSVSLKAVDIYLAGHLTAR